MPWIPWGHQVFFIFRILHLSYFEYFEYVWCALNTLFCYSISLSPWRKRRAHAGTAVCKRVFFLIFFSANPFDNNRSLTNISINLRTSALKGQLIFPSDLCSNSKEENCTIKEICGKYKSILKFCVWHNIGTHSWTLCLILRGQKYHFNWKAFFSSSSFPNKRSLFYLTLEGNHAPSPT